jgi:group I intron endonuclease
MSTLLKLTNRFTGKSYIGKNTHPNKEHRWKEHVSDAFSSKDSSRCLHRAIRKWGVDAFIFETVVETNDPEELAELETRFIIKFNTLSPSGYNSTLGGESIVFSPDARNNMRIAQRKIWANSPNRKKALSSRSSGSNNNFFGKNKGEDNGFFGKTHSENSRKLLSDKTTGTHHNWIRNRHEVALDIHQTRAKNGTSGRGNKWITNDTTNESKNVTLSEVNGYIQGGWRLGRRKGETGFLPKYQSISPPVGEHVSSTTK